MTDRPKVVIAMAVYKPNIEWFIKQLASIDEQDYPNVELLIWNDSPKDFDCRDIVAEHVTHIPYHILDNGRNNGVTKAFENLTVHADGKYIAYSDQDDVWMTNKISIMTKFMEEHPACACCHSDVELIDEENHLVRKSIYPKALQELNDVNYQKKAFLVRSWNVGCAMMMTTKAAKMSVPFPDMVYHDQWLEMYALAVGTFCYIPDCLIQHRVHGSNNSQTLHGIDHKQDYYDVKLKREVDFFDFLIEHLPCKDEYRTEELWIKARKDYCEHHSPLNFVRLAQYLRIRPTVTLFELLLPFIPDVVFSGLIQLIRKEVRVLGYR